MADRRCGARSPLARAAGEGPGVRVGVRAAGFTLIELLVVLAIIGLLITIAVPRYVDHVERARETALKTDLKVMREAIDKFEADQGRLPKNLDELVALRYLKEIPIDPITGARNAWIPVSAAEEAALLAERAASAGTVRADAANASATPGGAAAQPVLEDLADVHSGAKGTAKDGTEFAAW